MKIFKSWLSCSGALYAERIVRVGGSLTVMVQYRTLVAQASVGLIPGDCQPFHFPLFLPS